MADEENPKEEAKPAEAGEKPAASEAPKGGAPAGKKKGSGKVKTADKKGKRVRTGRKHERTEAHKFYNVEGDMIERTKKHCPRCGPGTFLAEHKSRRYCGRCGYTIFEKKTAE